MLLAFENPAAFRGRLTAKPSGKFCIPMPIARFLIGKEEEKENFRIRNIFQTFMQRHEELRNLPCTLKRGRWRSADRPKADPHRQSLRDVVHGDGHDEQKDPPPVVVVLLVRHRPGDVHVGDALLGGVAAGAAVTAAADGVGRAEVV